MDEFVVSTGTGVSVGTGVTTYSGLVSTLGDWLNRDDLGSKIPDFITLLEARLNRILRLTDMEAVTTIVNAVGTVVLDDLWQIALPTDFLEVRSLRIADGVELEQISIQAMHELYKDRSGTPQAFAIAGGYIHLAPRPSDQFTGTLDYYAKIEALSSDNESNWLSLNHPDVYLYGALVMAEAFLWNDERLPLWKSAWDEALGELQSHGIRKRHGGTLVPRASNVV